MQKMVGRSRISGVPRVGDKETSDKLDMVQTRASQTSHMHLFTGIVLMVTFEVCKRDGSRSVSSRASRRSRDVRSGSSGVHDDGRGNRGGSGTRLFRRGT